MTTTVPISPPPPSPPDGISAAHLADGGVLRRHASPLSIIILGALLVAALSGWLGGARSSTRHADTAAARLSITAPTTLRNGLFFEMRVTAIARRDLARATIVIPPDLWRDMTINSQIPAPLDEAFRDGAFRFGYGALKKGETLAVKIDGQINPPLFGGTTGWVGLADGDRIVATIPVTMRVLP